jgi:hypothetical protein
MKKLKEAFLLVVLAISVFAVLYWPAEQVWGYFA